MADIVNIVSVSLLTGGQAAERDNPNIVAIMTSQTGVLSTAERYRSYVSALAVAVDWGSNSVVTAFANVFFSQQPNPVNAGGRLIVGFWRSVAENVAASAAKLYGGLIDPDTVIAALQQITAGKFTLDVDGTTVSVTALNFQSITTLAQAAAVIDAGLPGATVAIVNDKFVITSGTTGALSTLTFAVDPGGAGTYIGDLLAISAGSGATITNGAAASVNALETKVAAVTALKTLVNYKGFMFIDIPTAQESKDLATFAQANSVLGYDVFTGTSALTIDPTQTPWYIKLAGQKRYRMLYRIDGSRKFAAGYMARTHVVNFSAANSAITMQLKEILSVPAEAFSQTQIDKAKSIGLDISTTFKNTAGLLTSGANGFTDNEYNLLAFLDAIQTDLFNILKTTSTKIPQTTPGLNALVDQAEKTTDGFVKAGVYAPGEWTSPDFFGDQVTFLRNIRENGYYWLANRLSDQSVADRNARKSPPIQGAVKFSGAFHSLEVIINVNE